MKLLVEVVHVVLDLAGVGLRQPELDVQLGVLSTQSLELFDELSVEEKDPAVSNCGVDDDEQRLEDGHGVTFRRRGFITHHVNIAKPKTLVGVLG